MENIRNKICLITGATSGIGKATAFELLKLGATLILLVNNRKKAEKIFLNRNVPDKVKLYKIDLSKLSEVREVCERINSEYDRIDVVINNAGGRYMNHIITEEGFEQTLVINCLSHFLLTSLLIDKLKNSKAGRIINVSSATHYSADGVIRNILDPKEYDGKIQYANSKLAVLLFTYELAERLRESAVTVNAVDPGGVMTKFALNDGLFYWLKHVTFYLKKGKLLTPKKGAETIIYLAVSDEINDVTGKYFYKKKEKRSSALSYDADNLKNFWALSERLISQKDL